MVDGVAIESPWPLPERTSGRTARDAVTGERLALGAAAASVALLPLLRPEGPGNTAPVDLVIAVAIFASLLWAGTAGIRWRFPYALPVAVFMLGGALGAVVGPVPGAGITALVQDLWLLLWCWAVANVARSPARLKMLLRTWAYSSIVWVTLLFVGLAVGSSFLTGQTTREGSRTSLTLIDPNVSANYYVISLMIIWATRTPRSRPVRLAAYGLLIAAILSTGSNSGVVSLTVAMSVAGLLGLYRRTGAAATIAVACFLLVGAAGAASTISVRAIQERAHSSHYAFLRDGIGRGAVSVEQRGTLLHESIPLYERGGLLGQGPVSTKPRLQTEMAPFVKEAHDDYAAALIERGLIGMVGLLMLIFALGSAGVSVGLSRLKPDFAGVLVRPNALVGALVGTMVAETVYELLHVRHVWALFGLVAAVVLWGRE
jgi:hypothetical protein